jgi:bifunctional non-homologous end joining protein LigD
MSLDEYKRKRDFRRTPEPEPAEAESTTSHSGRFFVQRHDASHLHYDFRLELGGTLKSWAVPKGPSLDPSKKHFAAMVEDHPLDYGDFEGNIPKGEYGGGSVMLWDRGVFEIIGEEDGLAQIARGDLKFRLHGEKLSGTWAIVFMKGRGKGNEWLIIKKQDEAAQSDWDIEALAWSVKTGRTQEEIAADLPAKKPSKKKVPATNWRSFQEQSKRRCRAFFPRWHHRSPTLCPGAKAGCMRSSGTASAPSRTSKTAR